MTSYEVLLAPGASKVYSRTDPAVQRRLKRGFEQLATEPNRHPNIKRLKGEFAGLLRLRVADWRIIYRVNEGDRVVTIIQLGHRRDVYE